MARRRKGMGLLTDVQDERDFQFKQVERSLSLTRRVRRMPKKVDLRRMMSPIRNQGSLGSCTAFATAVGLMESTQLELHSELELPLSPLFLYYETRKREHRLNQDSGASLRSTIKAAAKIGVCGEDEWPYKVTKFKKEPPAHAYDKIGKLKIGNYYRVRNADEIRKALAYTNPVVFGLMLYDSFNQVGNSGIVKMPKYDSENFIGGHAMCCVGYDNAKQHFIVRNSWGTRWGDKGYCYIPYDYMADRQQCVDMWTCTFAE